MTYSCSYCGRIHRKGDKCPKKPHYSKSRSFKDRFRSTAAWQKVRNAAAERDHYSCCICEENGDYMPHEIEVHHITPLYQDYSRRLDMRNLISLCAGHHRQADEGKIDAEKLRRIAVKRQDEFEALTGV